MQRKETVTTTSKPVGHIKKTNKERAERAESCTVNKNQGMWSRCRKSTALQGAREFPAVPQSDLTTETDNKKRVMGWILVHKDNR